ncbi:MAG TPA: hypothetical protein VFK08_07155, partial [Rhodanobacteraceae bacterium]|nr:hypothetical protein [Rhodanobacteraceae bacterium]
MRLPDRGVKSPGSARSRFEAPSCSGGRAETVSVAIERVASSPRLATKEGESAMQGKVITRTLYTHRRATALI